MIHPIRGKKIQPAVMKLFIAYLSLFYLLPQVFLQLFSERISAYNLSNVYLGWLIIFVPSLLVLLSKLIPVFKVKNRFVFTDLFSRSIVNLFSILFLVLSVYYFRNYSINFRHVGSGLSSDYLLIIHYFLRSYFNAYLVVVLMDILGGDRRPIGLKKISIIVIIGNFLSLNSSLQIIYMSGYFIMAFRPQLLKVTGYKSLYVGITAVVVILNVFLLGFANKLGGYRSAIDFMTTNSEILILLGQRVSTMQISFLYYLNNLDLFENLAVLFKEFTYNFDNLNILLGSEKYSRADPWSVNRLNFLNISKVYNLDAGTSPGLVGSFVMIWPLSIVIISYLLYVMRLLSSFKLDFGPLGGMFVLILIFYPLFLSPWSLINAFSTYTLNTIFIIAAIKYSLKSCFDD